MPNRLLNEKSPYLLQHAHNPVDWYPWGEEAFERARNENRLIFLSIGYATCHWCHVMERESFEHQETADLLNKLFVPIKLDREERPDVDQVYMRALQAVGQQGGWPLNMFLTPDLRPITGGTYFPPEQAYGRPSFRQILTSVADAWHKDPQKLVDAAKNLTTFLEPGELKEGRLPGADALATAAVGYSQNYDRFRGGFINNGPNKFPPSMGLLFLLRTFERTRVATLLEIAENTLGHMIRGGIYDQIGGGLSRYSTDHDWLVPHFEKMLYDNALFAMALTETYRLTQKEQYRTWALDVFAYLERDMTSPEGAFFSAEDADSEGEEGLFYVWKHGEFQDTLAEAGLTQDEVALLLKFWGVTARGNFESRNILHEKLTRAEFAAAVGVSPEALSGLVARARSVLLEKRSERKRPLLDDKILTGWNALAISALAQASRTFAMPELAARAARATDFVWKHLRRPDGGLHRRFRDGEAKHQATLGDYALLGCALIDLYRATFEAEQLARARAMADQIVQRFKAPGGAYFDADSEVPNLIVRTMDSYDGVEPSGNSAAARLFLGLSRYGIDAAANHERASAIVRCFAGPIVEYPSAHPALLTVADSLAQPPVEVAIIGNPEALGDSLHELNRALGPDGALAVSAQPVGDDRVPLLSSRVAKFDGATFYVCRDLSCAQPVGSWSEARELMERT